VIFPFWDTSDVSRARSLVNASFKKKILVVDDDEELTQDVKRILERAGFLVETAFDGLEAKDLLCSGQFDLVLSDICMPILDGVSLFRFAQETDKVPFILMSGFSDLRRQIENNNLIFDGLLSKPFGRKDLMQLVNLVLS
jgi:DNA-binding response OmpR family regulator